MSKLRFPCPRGLFTGHCGGWGGAGRGRLRGTSDLLRPIVSPAMPVRTPCPTAASAAERARLKKMAYGHRTEHRAPSTGCGCGCVRGWCCTPRVDAPTMHRPGDGAAFGHYVPPAWRVRRACPGSKTVNAAAAPPRSAPTPAYGPHSRPCNPLRAGHPRGHHRPPIRRPTGSLEAPGTCRYLASAPLPSARTLRCSPGHRDRTGSIHSLHLVAGCARRVGPPAALCRRRLNCVPLPLQPCDTALDRCPALRRSRVTSGL